MHSLRVLRIVEGTSVDGPRLRTSVYLAGCPHHCLGCHNPQSWDFAGGEEMTVDQVMAVVNENDAPVTLSGGDPLAQAEAVGELARRVKAAGYNLWCFTGYTWEEIQRRPDLMDVVGHFDVLVDGRFEQDKRDISLLFRGSANQRLIDVRQTLKSRQVVIWQPDTAF